MDAEAVYCGKLSKIAKPVDLCDTLTLEDFRRETLRALNHNERTHSLQRQTRRDGAESRRGRRTEELIAQSGALALVTNLVMAWNTHQMQAILDRWRAADRRIDPKILHHITPMGFQVLGDAEDDLFGLMGQMVPRIRRLLARQHLKTEPHMPGLHIADFMVRGALAC